MNNFELFENNFWKPVDLRLIVSKVYTSADVFTSVCRKKQQISMKETWQ